MKILKSLFYSFIAIFLLYIIVGFLIFPYILKSELIKTLDEKLISKTKIEEIYFNPLKLEAKIKNLALIDKNNQTIVSLKEFVLDFAGLKSIERRYFHIEKIILNGIFLNIIEEVDGSINIAKLIKEVKKEKNIENESTKLDNNIKFLIAKITLNNANIDFSRVFSNQKYNLNLKDINYTIYDFGTLEHSLASNNLEFLINKDTLVKIGGAIKLDPFFAYGQIDIKNLKIKDMLNYDKKFFNFLINNEANLNIVLNYNFNMANKINLSLNSELFELNNIKIEQEHQQIASLEKLDIKSFNFDLDTQHIDLKDIFIHNLETLIVKDNKNINLANLVNIKTKDSLNEQKSNNPWRVDLTNINLDSKLKFLDKQSDLIIEINRAITKLNHLNIVDSKVFLDELQLNSQNFSFIDNVNQLNIKDELTNIDLKNLEIIDSSIKTEELNIRSKNMAFKEGLNQLDINSKNIELNLLNLLIQDEISLYNAKLKAFINYQDKNSGLSINSNNINILLNKFLLNVNNDISIKSAKLEDTSIDIFDKNNAQSVTTKGSNLTILDTLFETKKNSLYIDTIFFKEPNINILDLNNRTNIKAQNIDFNIEKLLLKDSFVKISKTRLNNPHISIVLEKNETSLTKKDIETSQETVQDSSKDLEKKDKFRLILGPVDIKNMKLDFEDKNLAIPFRTTITKLNGEISELKSKKSSTSKLFIKGIVDKYGLAEITGTINPNDIKILTDINMKFQNISMNSFTPYSAKFVGREIKDGKLELDLNYNITKSNLHAKNNIVIKQLSLGNKVESTDAISLPLDLAITLLEDSSKTIDINLPVSGNVDDPEFSIASIIWKAFVNLITKAITAPFSLLGSLFGFEDHEISSVNFNLQESKIGPIQQEILDKIAVILSKKSNIAIIIEPSFDEKTEKEQIAQIRVKNIKEYLIEKKLIKDTQIIIGDKINKTSPQISLNIKQL